MYVHVHVSRLSHDSGMSHMHINAMHIYHSTTSELKEVLPSHMQIECGYQQWRNKKIVYL